MEIKTSQISCGIAEIYNFWGVNEFNMSERKAQLLALIKNAKENELRRIFIAQVTDNTKKAKELLESCGFKLVQRFMNARSQKWNNMYMYVVPESANKLRSIYRKNHGYDFVMP